MNHEHFAFSSPTHSDTKVILNQEINKAYILAAPNRQQLLSFLEKYELAVIDAFWDYALKPSPYESQLPYALACSSHGHSLLPKTTMLAHLPPGTKTLSEVDMPTLCTVVGHLKPKSIAHAFETLSENGRQRLLACSTIALAEQHKDFEELVAALVQKALSKDPEKRFALNCLIAMRGEGWLLLPLSAVEKVGHFTKGMKMRRNEWTPLPMDYLPQSLFSLYTELHAQSLRSEGEVVYSQVKARYAVLCSSLSSLKDLSWPFAERILFSTHKKRHIGSNGLASPAIRSHWRKLCEANGPIGMISEIETDYKSRLLVRAPSDPRLAEWVELLAKYCTYHKGGNMEPIYQAYGHWLSWLSTLQVVPRPLEIHRVHIHDVRNPKANTYRNYLISRNFRNEKNRNKALKKISDVFDRLSAEFAQDGKSFPNPVHRSDSFTAPRVRMKRGTHRKRLNSEVLTELKALIVEPHNGGFRWTPSLSEISILHLQLPGQESTVFCPIQAAILYLMLEYPLRSHQVRWLDSGELDPLCYDFVKQEFITNSGADGDRQNYGVLQPSDESPADKCLPIDMQVAVNKVNIDSRKSANYTIPYITTETLWVIHQVIEWQKAYGAKPKRVKEVFEPSKEKNRNSQLEDYFPDICPLFRYPLQQSYFPPSSQQLTYFWGQLCGQYDRIAEQWKDPKTGQAMRRPGAPILSVPYRKRWLTATHDLHSLRVAGVSLLLDSGIPLAVVASIAGHHTLEMTMHYYKMDRSSLRIRLQEAYAKMGDDRGWRQIETKLEDCQDYETWLKGTPDGFAALKEVQKTKSWTISISGICPGASCDEGLPVEFHGKCGSAVPGSKCPLCRYFVYGSPFLLGLIHEYNCNLFELEHKANRQAALRAEARACSARGEHGKARLYRGEDNRLELECQTNLKLLQRLYLMITECTEMVDSHTGKATPFALMTREPGQLKVRVERVGAFQRLKNLVEAADLLPGTRLTAADDAFNEMLQKILYCLRVNGASPFLAGLPTKAARSVALEFANMLEAFVPDNDQREKLIHGEIAFSELPGAEEPIRKGIAQCEEKVTQHLLANENIKEDK